MEVKFFFKDVFINIRERRKLKAFIKEMFHMEHRILCSLDYVFCSDEYLFSINKEFLHHSDYTDIITFMLSEPGQPITAEIYISVERVKENAGTYLIPVKTEIRRVMFHGVLHLCGFLDKTTGDKAEMTKAENKYLAIYDSNPS